MSSSGSCYKPLKLGCREAQHPTTAFKNGTSFEKGSTSNRVQTNLENLVNLEKQADFRELRENLENLGNLRKNAGCSWKTQGIFFAVHLRFLCFVLLPAENSQKIVIGNCGLFNYVQLCTCFSFLFNVVTFSLELCSTMYLFFLSV